ncbi:hypothetical protein BJ944DRAFT_248078 [Cunninghamella echinulata]|nr:hypothetical protein BJ944DRAFT_248078 [Cunninghamella echinulata]
MTDTEIIPATITTMEYHSPLPPTMDSVPGLTYFELNDTKKKDELVQKATVQLRCDFLKEGITDMTTKITQLQKELDNLRIETATTENVLCKFGEPDDRQLQALERRFHLHQQQFDQLLTSSFLLQKDINLNQQQPMTTSTSFTSNLSKMSSVFSSKKVTQHDENDDENEQLQQQSPNNNTILDNDDDMDEEDEKKMKRKQRVKQLRQEYQEQLKMYDPNWEDDGDDWRSIQFSIKDELEDKKKNKEKKSIIKKKPTTLSKKSTLNKSNNNNKNGVMSTSSSSSSIHQQLYNKPLSITSSTHYQQQQSNPHYNNFPLSPLPLEERKQSTMNLPTNNIYPPSTSLDTPPVTPIVANWIMDQQHQQPSSSSGHHHHPIDLPSSPTSPHPHRLSRTSLSKYELYNNNNNQNNNRMAISIASQPSLPPPSIISSTMHRLKSHRDAKKRRSQPLPYRHSLYDDVLNYFDYTSELGQDHDLNRDLNHLLSPTSSTQRQQRHLVDEENNNRTRRRRRRSNESHQRALSFHSSTSTSSSSIASSYMSLSSRPSIYSNLEANHQPWRHHQQLSPNYRRHDPYYKLNRNNNNNNKKRTRGGWNYGNGSRFSPLFYQLPLCALFIKQGILGLFSFLFGIVFGVFSYLLGGVQRILSWFKFLSVLSLALVISLGRGPSHMLASLDEGDYSDENINNEEDEDDYYMNHSF